jgi:hypothetical protein
LEFALGADIVRTAIAPTWDDIGQLAAIAAIRTFLNFFLERDLDAFGGDNDTKLLRAAEIFRRRRQVAQDAAAQAGTPIDTG